MSPNSFNGSSASKNFTNNSGVIPTSFSSPLFPSPPPSPVAPSPEVDSYFPQTIGARFTNPTSFKQTYEKCLANLANKNSDNSVDAFSNAIKAFDPTYPSPSSLRSRYDNNDDPVLVAAAASVIAHANNHPIAGQPTPSTTGSCTPIPRDLLTPPPPGTPTLTNNTCLNTPFTATGLTTPVERGNATMFSSLNYRPFLLYRYNLCADPYQQPENQYNPANYSKEYLKNMADNIEEYQDYTENPCYAGYYGEPRTNLGKRFTRVAKSFNCWESDGFAEDLMSLFAEERGLLASPSVVYNQKLGLFNTALETQTQLDDVIITC